VMFWGFTVSKASCIRDKLSDLIASVSVGKTFLVKTAIFSLRFLQGFTNY